MIKLKILAICLALILPIFAQDSHMYPKYRNRHINNVEDKMSFNSFDKPSITEETITPRVDDLRLPSAIKPISYFVRLQPFVNGDKSIIGFVEILFEVFEETSNVTLHMVDITYHEDSILLQNNGGDGSSIEFLTHSYDPESHFYTGELSEPLVVGAEYILSLDFDGIISAGFDGFYQSSYVDENGEDVPLATTQFQATHARQAFPCFDEPNFKATFQVEMGRENSHVVLVNTPLLSSRPIDGFADWSWDLFAESPIMSSYLVAFVVSDFVSITAFSDTGTQFNTWAQPALIEFGQYSLDVSPGISSFFEGYFEIPYPMSKQDQIAIPDFSAGAMENWGLITYREVLLLLDPVLSTTVSKRNIVQVIGHELAHMWTGNLVTAEWWNDLWLNEGFASYYEFVGTNAVEPDMDIMIDFVYQSTQAVFGPDSRESSQQVRYDVLTPDEIEGMFNVNTYSKGSCLVRMMEHFLTHDTFLRGMINYLNGNSYGNADQENLFAYLTDQAHLDGNLDPSMSVKEIMETWTLQPGYPVITVQVNGDGTATLTQERFLDIPNDDAIPYTYWVPISFASDTFNINYDTAPIDWMSPAQTEITIQGLSPSSSWHIFNIQQSSYYRVNYDAATWTGIANHLATSSSSVDPRNRAQLLDDSFILAETGIVSFETAFQIAEYLNNEDHYVPWKSALVNMGYIEEMLSRTASYTGFREYMQRALMPVYDLVGSVDSIGDPDRILFLREVIVPWACDMSYSSCLESASALFTEWMAAPTDYSIISPNLKSSVYCSAVKEGTSVEWEFSLDKYQTTESSDEAGLLLFAMACSQDQATINSYLDMIFNGNGAIAFADSISAFNNIASTDVGRDLAWDYLVNNYHAIADFYNSYITVQILARDASREFNTQKDRFELVAFRDLLSVEGLGDTTVIDAAISSVDNNIAWMERNYDIISGWLRNNGYGI